MTEESPGYVGQHGERRQQGPGVFHQGIVGHQECQLFRELTSQNSILFGWHSNRYSKMNSFI